MIERGAEKLFDGEAIGLPFVPTEAGAVARGTTDRGRLVVVRVIEVAWWLPVVLLLGGTLFAERAIAAGVSLEVMWVYDRLCEVA